MNDTKLIAAIADRASELYERYGYKVSPVNILCEVLFVHNRVCRLRELLDADDGNFAHDITGIHRHLDVARIRLTDGFCPRFANI
jgi:hypothetical protein